MPSLHQQRTSSFSTLSSLHHQHPPILSPQKPNLQTSMTNLSARLSSLLKQLPDPSKPQHGKKLHCLILKTVENTDTFVTNNLINLYAKSWNLSYARRVFDRMPHKNLISWNSMITGYSKWGFLREMENLFKLMPLRDGVSWNAVLSGYANWGDGKTAIKVYQEMLHNSQTPNRITFSLLLILSSKQFLEILGRQIHGQIIRVGFESNPFVTSPLIDMYVKCSNLEGARRVFDELSERNSVSYNTMITGYCKCGMVEEAKRIFNKMPERERDSVSWTTMITGYMQNGHSREALELFRGMKFADSASDQFTFGSVLTAIGALMALKQGKEIHAYIIRTNYQSNLFAGSALVDMYSKCGAIKSAETIFTQIPQKNVISWTAMLVGYAQNGFNEEAMRLFCELQRNGIEPDDYTLGSVISASASLASMEEGSQFHCKSVITGLNSFLTVANAIVTMYAKCGSIEEAQRMFAVMEVRDQVSWTALISGYAQQGNAKETIELYEKMISTNLKPDGVTFIAVLSACSRGGLVELGIRYYDSMIKAHGISPSSDHYTCMIDLLGRAGKLKEAEEFIKRMPFPPDATGWASLLSSCRLHGDPTLGKWSAESLLELEPNNPASYILLSSIYAKLGQWERVACVRRGMRERRVRKEPGFSWIKYKNQVHCFMADDKTHPCSDQIYRELEKLRERMEDEGYVPELNSVLHDVEDERKEEMLGHHSEKLAIAFGLMFLPEGVPIRIVKNLRVCGDCHTATKFISKITRRQILVRDAARFHRFEGGLCSCGDFW
ncbi:hypothetical protein AMTRI_Chr10g231690 [Amborella trichopoda]